MLTIYHNQSRNGRVLPSFLCYTRGRDAGYRANHISSLAGIGYNFFMSEYIEIKTELSDESDELHLFTNLMLADEEIENYDSIAAMEEGSPVAQALALIGGIAKLRIQGQDLVVVREPETPWYAIVAEISAALKDFFL